MKVRIKVTYYEVEEVNLDNIPAVGANEYSHPYKEEKWIKFCRKHNFNPWKDYYTKVYDLYLRLCAEGLVED